MIKKTSTLLLAAYLGVACQSTQSNQEEKPAVDTSNQQVSTAKPIGGDKDEHGCIGSAGYTWSPVKQDCIRIFEQIKLRPTTNPDAGVAFLLFSPDQTQAELFLPDRTQGIVMDRTGSEGGYVWKKDSLEVFAWKGYALRKNGKPIYHGE